MRCFVHREVDAVGICRQCGKALCPSCAREKPVGITCSEICEKKIADIDLCNEKTFAIYGIGEKKRPRSGLYFSLILGLGFMTFGLFDLHRHEFELGAFGIFLGGIYTTYCLYKLLFDKDGLRC